MTHERPMPEAAGKFGPAWRAECACTCGSTDVVGQTWFSTCGAYEDEKFTCRTCSHVWWVDGIDA